MTNMPEAKLAREAELPYASVAMVTDYDCWHPDHDHVEVSQIIACLMANAERAKNLIAAMTVMLREPRTPSPIDTALDNALITAPHARGPALMSKLSVVAGRVLGG
jgi:5'-methylthioadenosine phosphorylase